MVSAGLRYRPLARRWPICPGTNERFCYIFMDKFSPPTNCWCCPARWSSTARRREAWPVTQPAQDVNPPPRNWAMETNVTAGNELSSCSYVQNLHFLLCSATPSLLSSLTLSTDYWSKKGKPIWKSLAVWFEITTSDITTIYVLRPLITPRSSPMPVLYIRWLLGIFWSCSNLPFCATWSITSTEKYEPINRSNLREQ